MKILWLLGGAVLGFGGAYMVARKRGLPGAVALSNPTYVVNGQLAGRAPIGYILPAAPPAQPVPSPAPTL